MIDLSKKIKLILTGCLILLIFMFSIGVKTNKENNAVTSNTEELSNQKIGWGIKRKDNHEQPELGETNIKLISENNGLAIGNKEKPYIYLTFDLGYEGGYTSKILDSLKEKNVKATFFITAHYLNTASDLVERMINEGHIVGNHTVNHKSMPDISDEEIKKELMTLNQNLYEKFSYEMKYVRPPKGEYSQRTLAITDSLGFRTVMWSFAYVDWEDNNQPSASDAMNKIISNLHNGEIMLLHATSKTNSEIMGDMIDKVRQEGYEFRNLDEFVE